jgi:hypothetical protein
MLLLHVVDSNLLDFFITNGVSTDYMDVVPSYDLSSDHSPIILTVSKFIIHRTIIPTLHNKNTKWTQFQNIIEEEIELNISLKNQNEIDAAITTLTTTLIRAAKQAKPQTDKQKQTKTLPLEIKKLVAIKSKANKIKMATNICSNRQNRLKPSK